MAGITKDQEVKSSIVTNLKSTSMVSSKLLLAAKSLHADPNAPNAKNLLAQAARFVEFLLVEGYFSVNGATLLYQPTSQFTSLSVLCRSASVCRIRR